MKEDFRVKGKSCILALWIWIKAFDRVPREVIRWAMLGVEELLVSTVMIMYTGAKTAVRIDYGNNGKKTVRHLN